MQPALFDSSVYISALRKGDSSALAARSLAVNTPLWVSAVVLEELYAGADDRSRQAVERLECDFAKAKRILLPTLSDWTQTGKVLARLATRYGDERIGQARLTNDALIAMSAGRMGITVITVNERDFRQLAEFRPFHWRLARL